MKKNIAFLVYDVSLTGGAERVAINLSEELSNDYNVHLISVFKKDNFSHQSNYNFFVVNDKIVKIPYNLIKLGNKIRKYLKTNNIDILFSITAGVNSLALFSTTGLKTKFVYCEHSNLNNRTYGKKHEFRQFLGAKFADLIVTLTEKDKKNFIKKYKLPKEKVVAIPNWTNSKISSENYNLNSKKIISVGRLEEVKGYDLLVKVAKNVFKKHKQWHWDIYGEGTYHEKIKSWIKENNLENFITLKGNVNNLSEKNIYKDYAIYVMTSYYEGFSLTLLEAQSSKLPIVSFDSPTGPAEIIVNNINGFIVPTYDTVKMAEKINKLIENEKLRKRFSSNSLIKLSTFSKESILKKWEKIINNL